jgi:hypothetical protein
MNLKAILAETENGEPIFLASRNARAALTPNPLSRRERGEGVSERRARIQNAKSKIQNEDAMSMRP